jgi:hypothetical protein
MYDIRGGDQYGARHADAVEETAGRPASPSFDTVSVLIRAHGD